ncbi:MAG TPA: hypothetical protein VIE65_20805, partial [Methylobacter sp.]
FRHMKMHYPEIRYPVVDIWGQTRFIESIAYDLILIHHPGYSHLNKISLSGHRPSAPAGISLLCTNFILLPCCTQYVSASCNPADLSESVDTKKLFP